MDITSYLLGKKAGGGGGTTPTKGIVVDEWNNDGYPTKITVIGITPQIPNYFFSSSGSESFFGKVTTMTLPNNITSIGLNSFYSCASLKINKLANVTSISNSGFGSCTSIKKISLPSIQTLEGLNLMAGSFRNCTGLKQVWLGSTITNNGLARYVFYGCTALEKIYIDLPRATVEAFTNYQYAFMNDTNKTGIIVCNDDQGFLTEEQFDALVIE